MSLIHDVKELSVDQYKGIWVNDGLLTVDDKAEVVTIADALSHPNSTELFPITVEHLVREAIEPISLANQLLDTIPYTPGMQVSYGASGAVVAADIAEGSEYPEIGFSTGAGSQIVTIGKSGIALKLTEEAIRYNAYSQIQIGLKKMSQALVRHKEFKMWSMFNRMGVVTHDNLNPSASVFGATTGCNITGAANGSITIDDIYEAYGQVLMNGFIATHMVVHPMTFTMFLTDPLLQAFALASGGGSWMNGWVGTGVNEYPFSKGILGKRGPGATKFNPSTAKANELNPQATLKMPSYFDIPFKLIVSPYVPYDPTTKLTNIYFVDANNLGAIIVDELPTMDEVPDKLRDLVKIKIRERYALAPYNDGNACAIMKNVKVTSNKLIGPVQRTLSVSSITPQDRSDAISN